MATEMEEVNRLIASMHMLRGLIAELESVLRDHQVAERLLQAQVDDLQKLLDSRPPLNADIVSAYTKWTHMVYAHDMQNIRRATKGSL